MFDSIINFAKDILTNHVLVFPFVAYLTSQVLKVLFRFFGYSFRKEHAFLFDSGGMPSAHAAVVTAFTITIGYLEGVSSVIFGLSVIFAAIVIYDAIYVRGRADKQAIILNKISKSKLDTQEGHTYLEVIAGIIWGIIVATSLILICS